MADTKISAYTELTAPAANDFLEIVDVSDTAFAPEGTNRKVQLLNLLLLSGLNGGRLTTESGVPASTSDRTAQSNVYWTPHEHGLIALPVASSGPWRVVSQVETSISLSGLTANQNYDVFGYLNTGALSLELSAAWTNDTTRADALGTLDGVRVKNANKTRLYLGTIRATGTTTTEDSATRRFVWNAYNRQPRRLKVVETASLWTYSTDAWRSWNGSTANRAEFVRGLDLAPVRFEVTGSCTSTVTGVNPRISVSLDGTTTNDADTLFPISIGLAGISTLGTARIHRNLSAGYHFLQIVERGAGSGTQTFHGNAGAPDVIQNGGLGEVWG